MLRRGSTGSAVVFVLPGHGVTEGARIRVISLCFVSCHKKKRKRSKKLGRGGKVETEEEREKKRQSEPAGFPRLRGTTGHFCRL